MAKRKPTPPFVKRCVRAVAKRYDGDVSKGFAICVAQYQKSGHLKKGTIEMTRKGQRYAKQKLATDDHAKKVGEYERQLRRARKRRRASKNESFDREMRLIESRLASVEKFLHDMADE